MTRSPAEIDRACGVLLGMACGDALGVPYEFARPPAADGLAEMIGGGLGSSAPGEWSDDTAMAVAIAEVAATGAALDSPTALDAIADGFLRWFAAGPPDVGIQTSAVLSTAQARLASGTHRAATVMTEVAAEYAQQHPHSAGNGALMRTAPVAVADLDDREHTARASRVIAELTHADPLAGDSCVLWSEAIRLAVLTGRVDVAAGLDLIPESRRDQWRDWLAQALQGPPGRFTPNGYTVTALQAALSAIALTEVPPEVPSQESFACLHLQDSLHAAIRIGNDTDTVAAIAGGLLGARWGVSAIPATWRQLVHGWPGLRAADLVNLMLVTTGGGRADRQGWPGVDRLDYSGWSGLDSYAVHPLDPGVHLSGAAVLDAPPAVVDAVVSLCRLGSAQVPQHLRASQVDFRLLDTVAEDNANLAFALDDAARTVARLRKTGHTVLVHCVAAQSRTPTVAIRYAMLRGATLDEAQADIQAALPASQPKQFFVDCLAEFA